MWASGTLAAFFALFTWWFSTGVIMLIVRRADRSGGHAHRIAVLAGLPLVVVGAIGAAMSAGDASTTAAYVGFVSALAIWAWIELSFLTGAITGPGREACPPSASGVDRVFRAWNAIAHHEIALLAGLLAVIVASHGEMTIALSTYLILLAARISAKLNLFFGVPRINFEFIPLPLDHMKRYFRQGPVTAAFPVAILGLSGLMIYLVGRITDATGSAQATGAVLLATLTALALLEHLLMVLPLPDAKLWRWMLPAPATPASPLPRSPMTPNES